MFGFKMMALVEVVEMKILRFSLGLLMSNITINQSYHKDGSLSSLETKLDR